MRKEFATITTLRLDRLHKDKLERIINKQMQVTAKTQAGAIRQMIGIWEYLITEVDRLEADNRALSTENQRFTELIDSHVATAQAMQAVFDRKRWLPGEGATDNSNLPDNPTKSQDNS